MLEILQSTATIVSPAFNQSFNTALSDLIQLAVLGLIGVSSVALKAWIGQMKYDWQKSIALKLVAYAEQKLLTNDDKLTYVKSKLKEALPRLSDQDIDHLVESSVLQLKATLGTINSNPPAPTEAPK